MKPFPTTSTRPRGTRSAPRSTHASGSTYVHARVVEPRPAARPSPAPAPARRTRRARSSARRELLARRLVPARQRGQSPHGRGGRARRAARPPSARRPRGRAPVPRGPGPSFSTSEPHSPQASTCTSSPPPAGSAISASAGLARLHLGRRRAPAYRRRGVSDAREGRRRWLSSSIAAATCGPSSAGIRAGACRRRSTTRGRVRGREGVVAGPQGPYGGDRGNGPERLPAIELEDGTWYREESAEMARAIRAGRFSGGSPS